MDSRLRVGLFPYLNVQPLVHGLRGETGVEIVIDVPSRIAERFADGSLDLAMVPSFEAATLGAPVLDSICISSDGPVETVMLHHRTPLREVKSLCSDTASRTSAALAKTLIARAAGQLPETSAFSPSTNEPKDADAILIIGDPAFRFARPGYERLDLGEAWKVQTSLPFVFAVMVLGPGALGKANAARMSAALSRGIEAAPLIAASYNSGVDPARAFHYMTSVIRYGLGRREKEGLAHFYRLARECGLLTQVKELEFHAV